MYRATILILMGCALHPASLLPQSTDKPAAAQTTFSGTLLDADCKADDASAKCQVLPNSKAFGIQTREKYLKLDSKGNARVDIALRRIKNKTGDLDRAGVIRASVTGTLDGETIKVDSVELY